MKKKTTNTSLAAGRRKTAVARAYLREGKGQIKINGKSLNDYFPVELQRQTVLSPLKLCEVENRDIVINVKGGGPQGQMGAIRHAISRALVSEQEERRSILKEAGFLTRDPRRKERKKPGKPKARKSFQFSKR
ncbi:MAG: 30S ribosomal protein S9 [Chlamydiia bacterium]|nr:30S ribosomal protein S9 [Chlamydiia bacterium]